jgi:hypothetical protein
MKNPARLALVSVLLASALAFADFDDRDRDYDHDYSHRQGFLLDSSPQGRPLLLSVHGILPYRYFGYGGFPVGVGVGLYVPILHNGFIPPVNDEFGIDFGGDVFFFAGAPNGIGLWIPVSLLWTFHFSPSFSAYVKAGIALRFWPGDPYPLYPDFVGAIGLNWMFSHSVGLRVEAGYPGLKLGLLFAI